MAYTFQEIGGPVVVFDEDGQVTGTREFIVDPYSARFEFADDLRGKSQSVGGSGAILKPKAHFPDFPSLLISKVTTAPFDPEPLGGGTLQLSSGESTYSHARVTAEYRTLDIAGASAPGGGGGDSPSTPAGTYLAWDEDIGQQILTVPGEKWVFPPLAPPDNTLPDDTPVGILIPTATHILTWTNVAVVPRTAMRKLRGRINDAVFLGAPIGCVMFIGGRISRVMQTDGSVRFGVSYTFEEKTIGKITAPDTVVGWNYFYSAKGDAGEHWLPIENYVTGEPPFQSGNLNLLFQYA